MKIQCDVCEKAPAAVICCADEAALCGDCDVQVHAANKLASKHQRLQLDCLSNKLPHCDICQEKAAFIFCVEDRALFCRDCDKSVHVEGTLSGNHQRLLATGIRVALTSACGDKVSSKIRPDRSSKPSPSPLVAKAPVKQQAPAEFSPSAWSVDEFLQLSDYESGDKRESPIGFGELEWLTDISLFDQIGHEPTLSMAEVPELPLSSSNNANLHKPFKSNMIHKKPRIEMPEDEDEFFIVPDLG